MSVDPRLDKYGGWYFRGTSYIWYDRHQRLHYPQYEYLFCDIPPCPICQKNKSMYRKSIKATKRAGLPEPLYYVKFHCQNKRCKAIHEWDWRPHSRKVRYPENTELFLITKILRYTEWLIKQKQPKHYEKPSLM